MFPGLSDIQEPHDPPYDILDVLGINIYLNNFSMSKIGRSKFLSLSEPAESIREALNKHTTNTPLTVTVLKSRLDVKHPPQHLSDFFSCNSYINMVNIILMDVVPIH